MRLAILVVTLLGVFLSTESCTPEATCHLVHSVLNSHWGPVPGPSYRFHWGSVEVNIEHK